MFFVYFFFFFQAEDGIRDGRVTGVQTCALPISHGSSLISCWDKIKVRARQRCRPAPAQRRRRLSALFARPGEICRQRGREERSEERRVGKEGRSRWWADH